MLIIRCRPDFMLLTCVISLTFGLVADPSPVLGQNFAKEPVIVEYDVEPDWPQRPESVSGKGWVSGLAIDSEDQVWVCRKATNPVRVYRSDGTFVKSFGGDDFVQPHHLRIDHDGNIWVADFGRHILLKFTPEGKPLMTLGVEGESGDDATHFNRPTDIAIARNGDLFVSDGYGNRRIVHLDKDGKFINAWGEYGSGPGQFVLPHAIVLDSGGKLYVADRNSGRIQIFDQQGKFLDQWTGLLMPWGLSITDDDDLWVCGSSPHWWKRHGKYPEYKDQLFVRLANNGRVKLMWTIPLGDIGKDKDNPDVSRLKPGEAVGVHCIGEDSKGNVYVGDIYGERIQKFVPVTSRPQAPGK